MSSIVLVEICFKRTGQYLYSTIHNVHGEYLQEKVKVLPLYGKIENDNICITRIG